MILTTGSSTHSPLRIGTRGSPLALAQAVELRARLTSSEQWSGQEPELVIIKTSGDLIQDRALADVGGKGLFTKEIDDAILRGEIDLAVHSSKDLPTRMPQGIALIGFLEREDPRDAFISTRASSLAQLPQGATLGTASLRRQAMALRLRPDLKVRLLRGNVETRLSKIASGEFDATLLAYAGLKRLGLENRVTAIFSVDEFLPAVGQGAIGLTARSDDARVRDLVAPIIHSATCAAVETERAFLAELDGSCRTAIAGYARVVDGALIFRGIALSPNGAEAFASEASGPLAQAHEIGRAAGLDILGRIPSGFLAIA